MATSLPLGLQGVQGPAVIALLTAPWLMTGLAPHDQSRIIQVLLCTAAAILLLLGAARRQLKLPGLPARGRLAAGLLLGLLLASCAGAADPDAAMQDIALHLGLIGLALAVCAAEAPQQRSFERGVMLAPALLGGVMALIYFAALAQDQPLNARQMHLGFSNPRFLNHAQTLFVPWLLLVFPLNESRSAWRRLAWAAAVLHIAIAYLDVARGTWLAWGAAGLLLWLQGTRQPLGRFALALAVGLLLGVLVADALPALGAYHWDLPFASKSEAGGTHSRDQLWAFALDMARSSPWLGHGGMSFAANAAARATHPHNIYLQWAAEYGLLALLLALALLLGLLARAWRQARSLASTPRDRAAALLAICAAALADALVSGNFVMPVSQIWIALAFGQLLAASRPAAGVAAVEAPTGAARWTPVLAALLCCSQLVLLGATLHQGRLDQPRLRETTPPLKLGEESRPRYWQNGEL